MTMLDEDKLQIKALALISKALVDHIAATDTALARRRLSQGEQLAQKEMDKMMERAGNDRETANAINKIKGRIGEIFKSAIENSPKISRSAD
jgi:uncharacterized protein YpuA (DUF1002 family)